MNVCGHRIFDEIRIILLFNSIKQGQENHILDWRWYNMLLTQNVNNFRYEKEEEEEEEKWFRVSELTHARTCEMKTETE